MLSGCPFHERGRHFGISTNSLTANQKGGKLQGLSVFSHLHVALHLNPFLALNRLPDEIPSEFQTKRWYDDGHFFLPSARTFGAPACDPGPGRLLVCIPALVRDENAMKPAHAGPPRFTELSKSAVFPPRRSVRKKRDVKRVVCFFTEVSEHEKMALLAEKGDESLYDTPGSYLEFSDGTDRSKMWTKGSMLELQTRDNAYKAMTESPISPKETDLCATIGPKTLGRNALPTSKDSSRDPPLHRAVVVVVGRGLAVESARSGSCGSGLDEEYKRNDRSCAGAYQTDIA